MSIKSFDDDTLRISSALTSVVTTGILTRIPSSDSISSIADNDDLRCSLESLLSAHREFTKHFSQKKRCKRRGICEETSKKRHKDVDTKLEFECLSKFMSTSTLVPISVESFDEKFDPFVSIASLISSSNPDVTDFCNQGKGDEMASFWSTILSMEKESLQIRSKRI